MYCTKCGYDNPEGSLYCAGCGAQLTNNTQTQGVPFPYAAASGPTTCGTAWQNAAAAAATGDPNAQFRFQRAVMQKDEDLKATWQAAQSANEEAERLSARWRNCMIVSVIVFICLLQFYISNLNLDVYTADATGIASLVIMVLIVAIASCAPFGIMPFVDFARDHGFFIIVYIPLLLVGLVIAMFVGVPYVFILRSKIGDARARAQELTAQAQQIQAQLAEVGM